MAVTPVGNPYVESSDLVANYPGASEALAERIDIVGVNPFANAAARDAAIPSPVQGQMCSLNDDNKGYRYDGSAWLVFSGAGDANFTNAATGTFSSGGIDYKFITFTGSGELIVDQAGFADILVIGGGNSGGLSRGGGGGAGGYLLAENHYLGIGTTTVTVGGAGSPSRLGNLISTPGGVGGAGGAGGGSGASGGGGGGLSSTAGGTGVAGLGNNGGSGDSGGQGGGGGGSGAVGGNATAGAGGAGGVGTSSSITGSAVFRAAGGGGREAAGGNGGGGAGVGGAVGVNATINTGSGGGGGGASFAGGLGASGIVIVRVVV